jgi:hypothetical protein
MKTWWQSFKTHKTKQGLAMSTIEQLKSKLASLQISTGTEISALEAELQTALNVAFDDCGELQKAIADVQNSNEYGTDGNEIYRWLRFDLSDFSDDREYLETYLRDHFVHADFENDALMYYIGPQLIINDDGDVYDEDSGKIIITETACADDDGAYCEKVRNALIENWMEKTGYFPGVFSVDRHGNVFLVNTQAK